MDKNLYILYKEDIESQLKKYSCVVFNSHSNQYFKEIASPQLSFEEFSVDELQQYIMALSHAELPLWPTWTDDIVECFKINSLCSMAHIFNLLIWNNQFDSSCHFLLIDKSLNIIDFDSLIQKSDDREFIYELIDEYLEY